MSTFTNLATHLYNHGKNAAVKSELEAAGIPVLTLPAIMDGEVKNSHIGLLNGFVFTRAWRYWVCTGDMPLTNAKEIYQHYHHLAVRAEGHAGNIAPEGYSPIQKEQEREVLETMRAKGATTEEIVAALEQVKAEPNLPRFVRQYHIDTSEGLAALAEYIKGHNIYAHNGEKGSYTASAFPKDG